MPKHNPKKRPYQILLDLKRAELIEKKAEDRAISYTELFRRLVDVGLEKI